MIEETHLRRPPLLFDIVALGKPGSGTSRWDNEEGNRTRSVRYGDCSMVSFLDLERIHDMEIVLSVN